MSMVIHRGRDDRPGEGAESVKRDGPRCKRPPSIRRMSSALNAETRRLARPSWRLITTTSKE